MKNLTIVFGLLFFLITSVSQAQEDIVHMLNGDEKKGKVTAVKSDAISFVYSGEDLEYELKKQNIHKIDFASGRTEVYNQVQNSSSPSNANANTAVTSTAAERKNKIAVLPFKIISNNASLTSEGMMEEVQNTTANSIRSNTSQVILQDPSETNAILYENNIGEAEASKMRPADIAQLLGVEFVVIGSANIDYTGSNTYGSSRTTYKDKQERDRDSRKSSGKENTYSSSSSTENYSTNINLKIFNDEGRSVYSVDRTGIGTNLNKYETTISYLIKRSPWGSKR
ncbi:hypothetical protein [Christiangramia sp. SM2212]|uniref:Uncharacterized protein n=1 Tax=Christiangramia sediminicola TaxID=3073267 RepID=A0ABU1EQN0_9FLAO|nr:hypothetical protein [Christiangramia sp. SM2212]MDR5590701.1 hypothetical protein [Christiangramia sp. SM2212]